MLHSRFSVPNVSPSNEIEKSSQKPWGLRWRSSIWFITLAIGIGVTTDILVYTIIVPVIPFRLQALGYDGVSGLVGWLLFAYSGALVLSTPPIAYLSERFKNRRIPLLCGQISLIGAQVMLMEAPNFWVMTLARVAQGVSGSVIWIVGLALVCDTVPEAIVGKQMGLVMMGISVGALAGPPVAGALDNRFGFRAPFIFGIIITGVEFICRLLIIEKKEAARWDTSLSALIENLNLNTSPGRVYGAVEQEKREDQCAAQVTSAPFDERGTNEDIRAEPPRVAFTSPSTPETPQHRPARLSVSALLLRLLKSPRAMVPVFLAFVYGVSYSSLEPALPLYLQSTYGLDVSKIGLVFIAAVVPSFISSPLSGWYADHGGTIITALVSLICSLPFYVLISIRGPLAYFLAMFALMNFFATGLISPIMAELAAAARSLEGVGYGHVYGAFNIAYGVGSATGPVIGGQLYDHLARGWMALSLFDAGMIAVAIVVTICFFGERPALSSIVRGLRGRIHVKRSADLVDV